MRLAQLLSLRVPGTRLISRSKTDTCCISPIAGEWFPVQIRILWSRRVNTDLKMWLTPAHPQAYQMAGWKIQCRVRQKTGMETTFLIPGEPMMWAMDSESTYRLRIRAILTKRGTARRLAERTGSPALDMY